MIEWIANNSVLMFNIGALIAIVILVLIAIVVLVLILYEAYKELKR